MTARIAHTERTKANTTTTQPAATGVDPAARRLLTPEEVSLVLGVTTKTLMNWRHLRVGPLPLRIGRKIHYRLCDLDDWIERQTAESRAWMAD